VNPQEQLKVKALEVNELLGHYILLHDRRLKSSATFKSILKNLFGKPIDFWSLFSEASLISARFESKAEEINSLSVALQGSLNDIETRFLETMKEYVNALCHTLKAFVALTKAQHRASTGELMSWKDNQALELAYKQSVDRYMTIGERLNNLYREINS